MGHTTEGVSLSCFFTDKQGEEPEMKVNGSLVSVPEGSTLAVFLTQSGYNLKYIAVEKNGAIVPKQDYETTRLEADDSLEIVCFVGGG